MKYIIDEESKTIELLGVAPLEQIQKFVDDHNLQGYSLGGQKAVFLPIPDHPTQTPTDPFNLPFYSTCETDLKVKTTGIRQDDGLILYHIDIES